MTEKLKQTIQEEVMKLPKETQEAVASLDWASIAEEIGKKYLLLESEINDLQVETLLVLAGLEDGEFFPQNIESNVETSKDEAIKIAEEVNQKIFTPISNILTEKIKNNLRTKNPNSTQTLNFILSGGDYSVFLNSSRPAPNPNTTSENNLKPNTRPMTDFKDKFTI